LVSRNKAGKAVLTVPAGGSALKVAPVKSLTDDVVVSISNGGSLLAFPVGELPEMTRGKGNKIYNIPGAKFKSGDESMIAVVVMSPGDKLRIGSGKRHTVIKFKELTDYTGARGQRGRKLPRGFQKVDTVDIE
jgi:topoisomerase-4 subunit A